MNTSRFVPIVTLLALGVAGCGPQKDKEPSKPKVAVADGAALALPVLGPAPSWKLADLNGKPISSEELKGKVVVVDFWATWCGPCRMEIPGYIALQKKYEKDGLVIVGVSLDEGGVDLVQRFVAQNRMNYPVVMGSEAIANAFGGMEAIPTTFLIDRAGQLRDRKMGVEETAEYEKKIRALLFASATGAIGQAAADEKPHSSSD